MIITISLINADVLVCNGHSISAPQSVTLSSGDFQNVSLLEGVGAAAGAGCLTPSRNDARCISVAYAFVSQFSRLGGGG